MTQKELVQSSYNGYLCNSIPQQIFLIVGNNEQLTTNNSYHYHSARTAQPHKMAATILADYEFIGDSRPFTGFALFFETAKTLIL